MQTGRDDMAEDDESNETERIQTSGSTTIQTSADSSGSVVVSVANLHRRAAAASLERAQHKEEEYEDFQTAQRHEYHSDVISCIICSYAFLEAGLTEAFGSWVNGAVEPSEKLARIDVSKSGWLTELIHSETEEDNSAPDHLLKRWIWLMEFLEVQPIDRGGQTYERANLLRRLRNEVVHGEVVAKSKPHYGPDHLKEKLQGEFETSPFASDSAFYFPHQVLSASCATWALNSAQKFVDEFCDNFGVEPSFASASD